MPDNNGKSSPKKNIFLWLLIGFLIITIFQVIAGTNNMSIPVLDYSAFRREAEKGNVSAVTFSRHRESFGADLKSAIQIDAAINPNRKKDEKTPSVSQRFIVHISKENIPWLIKELEEKNVRVIFDEAPDPGKVSWIGFLVGWAPMIILVFVYIWFMRRMRNGVGGGNDLGFTKNRAKIFPAESPDKKTFSDIAGCDEAKDELKEIVEFLSSPQKFINLGARIPKGVLMVGPPGTGKTLMAKAVAGEAKVPFFYISGSDFVELFVGVGAGRVRDLFEQGKSKAPCIIFIDEIDAVGKHRGTGIGGGHDEKEQTLNQILVEMDGFDTSRGVIIIAATNRPDVLDPALLRPGRFDRQVVLPRPDLKGREEILRVHVRYKAIAQTVDLRKIARGTPGFSGADLENLVNEALLIAARKNKQHADDMDFDEAKDKILMGTERKSFIMSEREKETTAFHEAGHAMVGATIYKRDGGKNSDPVSKVTIIPRGRALGMTQQLPVEDKYSYSRTYILNRIAVFLGGRVAEKLVFDEYTTGAGNDLERATEIARKMVMEWGMSDEIGPVTFGKGEGLAFLGRDIVQEKGYSEETARLIDSEIKNIIKRCESEARTILSEGMDKLHALARALLEFETLQEEEIKRILGLNPAS